nr:PREDICTED: zinc finger protein 408-like [Bemisia tabaci]
MPASGNELLQAAAPFFSGSSAKGKGVLQTTGSDRRSRSRSSSLDRNASIQKGSNPPNQGVSLTVAETIAKERLEYKFQCPHCPRRYKLERSLMGHLPSHAGETDCDQCNKKFGSINTLRRHKRQKHSG